MRAVDLIIKKRNGAQLSTEEIQWLIQGYTNGSVPDYQMAAWAMAVVLKGMDDRETTDLTLAMAASGDQLDLRDFAPDAVDKHSTGGVGDKTSLVLGPMLAAVGLQVAKMSGRGLGFSGGTLDKLEAIPNMRIDLSEDEFRHAMRDIGMVIMGQTADLAPADKKLYALRDVTGTVECIPLIAASIMSKKLAAGAKSIVLDVKVGAGAFMKTLDQARDLARTMVRIGQLAGRNVAAILSSMEQPLGLTIGNALEVREAIETLQGRGPSDLVEVCLTLGSHLLVLAGKAQNLDEARQQLQTSLDNGQAWAKFREFVAQQGGDLTVIDQPETLPIAPIQISLLAESSGFVQRIDAETCGIVATELGAGRARKEDAIDPAVGLVLQRKVGEPVQAGEALLTVHAADQQRAEVALAALKSAITISATPVEALPLVFESVA
ncbi:pyrimidine-nucleoside phosphorylase [Herpetosiphon gulosus]|uniref:Pyrimidine-nucleoside phosphorylase n=1 Tax=Herpetosiphon gulosus TaxID=1973496 RepID=A0ABP9X1A3_9CHLR